jgi:hypothetical protein
VILLAATQSFWKCLLFFVMFLLRAFSILTCCVLVNVSTRQEICTTKQNTPNVQPLISYVIAHTPCASAFHLTCVSCWLLRNLALSVGRRLMRVKPWLEYTMMFAIPLASSSLILHLLLLYDTIWHETKWFKTLLDTQLACQMSSTWGPVHSDWLALQIPWFGRSFDALEYRPNF